MDSMLAAEFRMTVFRIFKVDISFAVVLMKKSTMISLASLIAKDLLEVAGVGVVEE